VAKDKPIMLEKTRRFAPRLTLTGFRLAMTKTAYKLIGEPEFVEIGYIPRIKEIIVRKTIERNKLARKVCFVPGIMVSAGGLSGVMPSGFYDYVKSGPAAIFKYREK